VATPLQSMQQEPLQQSNAPRVHMQQGGRLRWWEELEGEEQQQLPDWESLSEEEVDDRVSEAAELISMLEDLRPTDSARFNAFAEMWKRIARVPPAAKTRLLKEISPGGIRSAWRASMSRYVLDDARALELLEDYAMYNDFPEQPGQVVTYQGRCEQFLFEAPETKFMVDERMQERYPRTQPWLRPTPGSVQLPQESFTQHFFLHPRTGTLHARVVLPLLGPIQRWWLPSYCKVRTELTLTPLPSDAGADMTFDYPNNPLGLNAPLGPVPLGAGEGQAIGSGEGGWELGEGDLPVRGWPAPTMDMWSPFGSGSRDYVRVAGPGVYVGCAYRKGLSGQYSKDDCLFFMLVRQA